MPKPNPLDSATHDYYNEDGKNVTDFIVFNRTKLQLDMPKTTMRGYAYPVKAKIKTGMFKKIKTDRYTWVWGVPTR
jgi:hypothetical protein